MSLIQKKKIRNLFFLFLLSASYLLSQKLYIKNYTTDDGLPSSQVWCSLQDSKGYIWFGTTGGLARFDGAKFIVYTVEDGLVNNVVRSLFEDNGTLWIGTHDGVSKFDGKSFKNYTAKDGLGRGVVHSITKFKGSMYFSTSEGGLFKFDGKKFTVYTTKDGLPSDDILPLLSDGKYLWIGTRGGLSRFDGKNFVNYGEKNGLTGKVIRSLIKKDSVLWIGTRDKGLFKFENGKFVNVIPNGRFSSAAKDKSLWFGTFDDGAWSLEGNFKKYTTANGLINNKIYSILVDRENSVWFTTVKGVSKLISKKFLSYLKDKIILSIYMFKGAMWFGTMMEGLYKLENNKLTHYTVKDGLLSNQVWALSSFKNKLWIGTYGGLNSFDGKKFDKYTVREGLPSNTITDLLPIGNNLWISTAGGVAKFDGNGFKNFTIKDGLPTNHVWSICQDGNRVWFATERGASCFDGKKFINYTVENGLSNNSIRTIFKDSRGILWFGTSLGLNRFDGKKFKVFTKKDGLSNNKIFSIIEYNGNLWIGTDKGLNIFRKGKIIKVYTKKNGLIGDEASTYNSLYIDKNQNIWFGSPKGVTEYIPREDIPNKVPPPVYIEKFLVNGSAINKREGLKLKHNENNVSFSYIALSYKDETDVRYQHKLEGYDKDWTKLSEKREISYTNLGPGHYTFKVRARNGDGYWSNVPAELSFVILSPFWKRWWFIGIAILFLLGLASATYKYRVNSIKKEKKKLKRLVHEKILELEKKTEMLNILAITDDLTQVYNRRFFMETLTREMKNMSRRKSEESLSLLILDVDHFKNVNDNYGHRAGDYVLENLAALIKNRIRTSDVLARYGGDEFSIVLPSTDLKGALVVAEDIRKLTEDTNFQFEGKSLRITISIGIGIISRVKVFHEKLLETLIKTADNALYEAKNKGRNRTCFREIPPEK